MEAQEYKKLVEALRLCQFGECGCGKCYYKELKGDWCTENNHPEFFDCDDKLKLDAAAAIEDLEGFLAEAERDRDEYEERMRKEQERVIELQAEADALAHDIERYVGINVELTTEIEELEAKNKELHGRIEDEELKIDFLTADSTNYEIAIEELKAQLPKRGEWIGVSPMVDTVQCSVCGGQLFSAELETPYCPYCGADMEETEDEVHSGI